ncbi:MAG TPA: heparinase II/III family protein, partial [Candidatus Hydrogenedentes bacterium]|nr:heparinase II/III family protein [Candidatus Hydrogenedentota bacterium]
MNEKHELSSAADWNNPAWEKLWLYNLHYFDDLNAEGGAARSDWHRALITRWVAENPVGKGNGWEPYPLSLRIVNWVKWAWAGNELPPVAVESLALQAHFLSRRLEWHILGNHLLANAKALIFAGLFFDGMEAERWLATGAAIFSRQLGEQVLSDGGHFERSPMYHAQVLE